MINKQQCDKQIAAYIWYYQLDHQNRTVAARECSDEQLITEGWFDKAFLFKAYKKRHNSPVAVYIWFNVTTGSYISVAEDEFRDKQKQINGYAKKHFQYYAFTRLQSSSNSYQVPS